MSNIERSNEVAAVGIEQIRRALGAVVMAEPAVFWIFLGRDGMWRTRQEGEASENCFSKREAARAFVEVLAARCKCYRIFFQGEDGGFAEEWAAWPPKLRRLISRPTTDRKVFLKTA